MHCSIKRYEGKRDLGRLLLGSESPCVPSHFSVLYSRELSSRSKILLRRSLFSIPMTSLFELFIKMLGEAGD